MTPEQLEKRKETIGASEIAALFDCHPYLTRYGLWARKVGLKPESDEHSRRLQLGLDLEQGVLAHGAWLLGIKIDPKRPESQTLQGTKLSATPDGFEVDEAGNRVACVEVKTSGGAPWDDIPEHYRLQMQQQMLVTGLPRSRMIALFGSMQVDTWTLDAHPHVHLEILNRSAEFWANIDTVPQASGEDDLKLATSALSTMAPEPAMELDGGLRILDDELQDIQSQVRVLEKRERAIKAEIIAALANGKRSKGIWADGTGWRVQTVNVAERHQKAFAYQKLSRFAGKHSV
jgi:predicted phage-related endonuclease